MKTLSATVYVRQAIEKAIAMEAVRALITAGYSLRVDIGEDEPLCAWTQDSSTIENVLFDGDDACLETSKDGDESFVLLVYGNDGWDVISDYAMNLEPALKPALDLATSFDNNTTKITFSY